MSYETIYLLLATITGIDAEILAGEVRKRRGTVYLHEKEVRLWIGLGFCSRRQRDIDKPLASVFDKSQKLTHCSDSFQDQKIFKNRPLQVMHSLMA